MPLTAAPITIALLRALGVRRLLVYCDGKRPDGWQCHHSDKLPIDRFGDDEVLSDIRQRMRCTACGSRRVDLRPDYREHQDRSSGGREPARGAGWIMPPGGNC